MQVLTLSWLRRYTPGWRLSMQSSWIGTAATVLRVEKVEGDGVDSSRSKLGRKVHHECARLVSARAVTEDQRYPGAISRSRWIEYRGYALEFIYIDSEFFGHLLIRTYFGNAGLFITSAICLLCRRLWAGM